MPQSAPLKSLARRQEKIRSLIEELTTAQESLLEHASRAMTQMESEVVRASYPGLNLVTLRDVLCPHNDMSQQAWLPDVIGSAGAGPWDSSEFDYFLQDRGIEPVQVPHPSITGLVIGATDWTEEQLEQQIYGRSPDDLRIYTQELFVLGLILERDPYDVLEQAPIEEVANHHPAIQHILSRDFAWPWPSETAEASDSERLTEEDFDWQQESVLKRLGYSARADGPGSMARQRMLSKAFESSNLQGIETDDERRRWGPAFSARRLYALSHFLRWLINFQGSDKPEAREKWLADLAWLRQTYYKPTMRFTWPTSEGKDSARTNSKAVKRTPNAAFMKPLIPSPVLAAVVGSTPAPRTEVVSRLWAYIKKNKLQDSANKRMVNADDKLHAIFRKRQVSMFEMAGLIGRHVK